MFYFSNPADPNKMVVELPRNEDGKQYWVPIIAKNKEQLIGFVSAYKTFSFFYDTPISDMELMLSSERFSDIMKDGVRMRELSRNELKERIKKVLDEPDRGEHIENDESIYEDNLITVTCPQCGMFYSFKNSTEVPEENFKCQMCNRVVIHYTGVDEDRVQFDGDAELMDNLIAEIHSESIGPDDTEQ